MSGKEERGDSYFDCSDRERAAFEAGIKMGTVYHQFVGVPVDRQSVEDLERCIESSVSAQPYVVEAKVSIDREALPSEGGVYGYASLSGDMIGVEITVEYGHARVRAAMGYVEELDYPLMWVRSAEDI